MKRFMALRDAKRFDDIIGMIPYAHLIGAVFQEQPTGGLLFTLPFCDRNIGNMVLPALHGGLVGGFLENAALLRLMWEREALAMPKIVDFSVDYLRSARPRPLYAGGHITKQGRRVAHVLIEAWQEDPEKPVAVARAHFLLAAPD